MSQNASIFDFRPRHKALLNEITGVHQMRTRAVHRVDEDTAAVLSQTKNGQTWRGLAEALGYEKKYGATLYGVVHRTPGVVTLQGENILRARLGLAPIGTHEVPPCPDCGNVHTGRCHGKPVAAVVCLAPDETVRPVAKAQRPRRTPYGALSLRRTTLDRLAQHRTGRTADALINALLDKWEQEPQP